MDAVATNMKNIAIKLGKLSYIYGHQTAQWLF